jgi:Domain of unknown function (DUF4349)
MSSFDVLEQIRAARPEAPPALRERVRAIAASEQPVRPSPFARLSTRRLALVAAPTFALVLVATAGLIGLARSGGEPARETALPATVLREAAPPTAADAQKALPGALGAQQAVPAPNPGRLERYEATLRVRVDDADELADATQRAIDRAKALGGFVVSLNSVVPEAGKGSAELVVRVPRERVQQAIGDFAQLGTVVAQEVHIEDLQQQVDAMTDRIAVLTAEIARIERQLKNPNLALETRSRLSARLAADRRELRELRANRAATTREGELATVSLSLTTEARAEAVPAPGRIDRALDRAGEVLAWEAAAVLLVLVAVGPLLVLAILAWLGLRIARRRSDERLLERA